MNSLMSQVAALIGMNIRSIPQRLWMSLAMIIASAVVVAVLLAFLAMAKGFEKTLTATGSDSVAIFMRAGSAAESNSMITREQFSLLATAPGVVSDSDGSLVSGETYIVIGGLKKSSQTEANIPLRGLNQHGLSMRDNVTITEGRMFTPGTNEVIVGRGLVEEFVGFNLGEEIRSGTNRWQVVGVFSANGTVLESELWADVNFIQSVYNRSGSYQSVRVQMATPDRLGILKDYIDANPRLNLDVQTEAEYFHEQSKQLSNIALFGRFISTVMALGALAGALNTMYTSVAERAREIATLRAIGFNSFAAFAGTLVEAIFLAVLGSAVGSLAAFILFDGLSATTLGGSFSQVVFSFKLTTDLFVQGCIIALCIGLISGFFPAWRAARLPVIAAFRASH